MSSIIVASCKMYTKITYCSFVLENSRNDIKSARKYFKMHECLERCEEWEGPDGTERRRYKITHSTEPELIHRRRAEERGHLGGGRQLAARGARFFFGSKVLDERGCPSVIQKFT